MIPAAGVGTRMGTDTPKQYLPLAGRSVIEHALERLAAHPRIARVVVALAQGDHWWDRIRLPEHWPVVRVQGGAERCHTVLNGLDTLANRAAPDDWVLVHDAVRPCVRRDDIGRLMDTLEGHPVGGLLGLPVRDTMKRADARGDVQATVSREGLWHALTPQMFRFGLLRSALREVIEDGRLVTDEAQAVELAGGTPRMVEGHPDNIKVTHPADMALAELFIRRQQADTP